MRRLLVMLIPLCMLACSDASHLRSGCILPDSVKLEVGDVVFRRGGGFTSQAVIIAEGGGAYSHVGIVVDSAGVKMIVHSVPGEPDFEGDEDRVKMERPEIFFNGMRALKGEVRRHRQTAIAHEAAAQALAIYKRGALFDHDYDDSDTTKMYCTELVVHAFKKTGNPLSSLSHQHLHLVGFESDCILPQDVLECKDLYQVIAF